MKLVIDPLLAHRIQLDLDESSSALPVHIRANAHLDALRVEGSDPESQRISFQRGTLQNIDVSIGTHVVQADSLTVEGAITLRDLRTELDLQTDAANLKGLRYRSEAFEIGVEEAALPQGVDYKGSRQVVIPSLVARNAKLVVPDLLAAFVSEAETAVEAGAPPAPPAPVDQASGLLGFEFLDTLNGHAHLDVDVHADVPVIKRREATHKYRIPIRDGTVSIEKLEDDLAGLEDAVIDFELEDHKLILEKDVPLIPWDNTTLVSWALDDEEYALAKKDRVRIRTLLGYQLHLDELGGGKGKAADKEKADAPPVKLRQIAARNLDVLLGLTHPTTISLGHAGTIHIGAEDRPGLADLAITGEVRFNPEQALAPTELQFTIKEIFVALKGLGAAAVTVDVDAIHLEEIRDAALGMAGLTPGRLELTIGRLTITNLTLTFPKKDAG